MADGPNFFDMTESALIALKKPESLYSYKRINGYNKSTFI